METIRHLSQADGFRAMIRFRSVIGRLTRLFARK